MVCLTTDYENLFLPFNAINKQFLAIYTNEFEVAVLFRSGTSHYDFWLTLTDS